MPFSSHSSNTAPHQHHSSHPHHQPSDDSLPTPLYAPTPARHHQPPSTAAYPASTPASPFHLNFHLPRVASFPRSLSSIAQPHPHEAAAHVHSGTSTPLDSIPTSPAYFPASPHASSSAATSSSSTMGLRSAEHHPKEKPHLDIILDAPFLTLRGTGPDVEPTTLSGHVALFLTEATSVKEITLQFRGKAKIPMPAGESLINSSTSITYVVCNHDWSFLEGDRRHTRTLKAGRHFFPFHLEIGGSLPSSISTNALGGASIAYKLRAVATRPGFHQHNLHVVAPVHLLRAFAPEALEYQQTLEIENTWPGKLMYALMLPHKAWAAGDVLAAVVKCAPLAKGVRVVCIESALWETTRVYARSGTQEESRRVCGVRHEIVGGRAVEVDWGTGSGSGTATPERGTRGGGFGFSRTATPAVSRPPSAQGHRTTQPMPFTDLGAGPSSSLQTPATSTEHEEEDEGDYENMDVVTYIKLAIPRTVHTHPNTPIPGTPAAASHADLPSYFSSTHPPGAHDPASTVHSAPQTSSNADAASSSQASAPPTPSHALDPIVVSHRIRWSILIRNRDGHTSELRCSLPLVILDTRVLGEARACSVPTRRLMMGSVGLGLGPGGHEGHGRDEDLGWGFARDTDDGSGREVVDDGIEGDLGQGLGEGDRELPSYTAHVRDRVANMFLPETATMRVSNPWVGRVGVGSPGALPTQSGDTSPAEAPVPDADVQGGMAGRSAPGRLNFDRNLSLQSQQQHLPHAPRSGDSTPLDWVNSELLLSLSDEPLRRMGLGAGPGAGAAIHSSASTPALSALLSQPQAHASGAGSTGTSPASATIVHLPAGVRTPPSAPRYVSTGPGQGSHSHPGSHGGSRAGSRWGSRAGSRAGSPERGAAAGSEAAHAHGGASRPASRPGSPTFGGRGGMGMSSISPATVPTATTASISSLTPASDIASAPGHPQTRPSIDGNAYDALPSPSTSAGLMSPASSGFFAPSIASTSMSQHAHGEKHGHGVRNLQSLFKATMKPFTVLAGHRHHDKEKEREQPHHGATFSASSSARSSHDQAHDFGAMTPLDEAPGNVYASDGPSGYVQLPHSASTSAVSDAGPSTQSFTSNAPLQPSAAHSTSALLHQNAHPYNNADHSSAAAVSGPALLHRALTEVPDYSIAARGFIGGVPPLSSMQGLPSYEEAARGARSGLSQTTLGAEGNVQVEATSASTSSLATSLTTIESVPCVQDEEEEDDEDEAGIEMHTRGGASHRS